MYEAATPNYDLLFRGTSGPRDARIAIVGEAWGAEEAREGAPFVGTSGRLLDDLLASAGIARDTCFASNVINARPPNNDIKTFFFRTKDARAQGAQLYKGLYPRPELFAGIEKLKSQLEVVKPDLIIACGLYALWALTNSNFDISNAEGFKVPAGIMKWRGSQLYADALASSPKLLPIIHPAAAVRQWAFTYTIRHDLKARVRLALADDWKDIRRTFIISPSFAQVTERLQSWLEMLEHAPIMLAADLETSGQFIDCCGLADSIYSAICIPFICGDEGKAYWPIEQEIEIVKLLRQIFVHPNLRLIGQNFIYDAQYIFANWLAIPSCRTDTMLLQHALWPGTSKGLDYLSSLYCHYHRYWKDESKHRTKGASDEQHWTYNCRDCVVTFEVAHEERKLLKQLELENVAADLMRQWPMALRMMLRGIKIDLETRARVSFEITQLVEQYEARFAEIIPESIWPRVKNKSAWWNSPLQQAEIFYDMLGIKPIVNRKTGSRTMNDEALKRIGRVEPCLAPLVTAMEEYRSLGVFQRNFCNAALDPDKRMRCSFNIAGTETFRWSSSENVFGRGTNLQNIPKGSED